jgi:hypothetical protein
MWEYYTLCIGRGGANASKRIGTVVSVVSTIYFAETVSVNLSLKLGGKNQHQQARDLRMGLPIC